jgi:hypothetical protein
MLLLAFLLILNLPISVWNAYVCGHAWIESKTVGGWTRFMVWIGAIMSACGFTWCYALLAAFGLDYMGFLDDHWMKVMLELTYIILVPIILFGGYAVMLDSWSRAFREGGLLNYGAAAYNTYANFHNTASAISGFGDAFGDVIRSFSGGSSGSDDDDNGSAMMGLLVIVAVAVSLGLGILTTTLIIKKVAASDRLRSRSEMQSARA